MYSFTRVSMGPKLARMLMSVRTVVSSTSTSEMPSTPTLYLMPRKAIQSACCTSWKPGWLPSKLTATSSETTKARPAVPSAARRMSLTRPPGHEAQDDGAHAGA